MTLPRLTVLKASCAPKEREVPSSLYLHTTPLVRGEGWGAQPAPRQPQLSRGPGNLRGPGDKDAELRLGPPSQTSSPSQHPGMLAPRPTTTSDPQPLEQVGAPHIRNPLIPTVPHTSRPRSLPTQGSTYLELGPAPCAEGLGTGHPWRPQPRGGRGNDPSPEGLRGCPGGHGIRRGRGRGRGACRPVRTTPKASPALFQRQGPPHSRLCSLNSKEGLPDTTQGTQPHRVSADSGPPAPPPCSLGPTHWLGERVSWVHSTPPTCLVRNHTQNTPRVKTHGARGPHTLPGAGPPPGSQTRR